MIKPNNNSKTRNAEENNLVDECSRTVNADESDRIQSDSVSNANAPTFREEDPVVDDEIDDSGALCF